MDMILFFHAIAITFWSLNPLKAQNMWLWLVPGLGGIHARGRWATVGVGCCFSHFPELSLGIYFQDSSLPPNQLDVHINTFLYLSFLVSKIKNKS